MHSTTWLGNHNLFETCDPELARDTLEREVGVMGFDVSNERPFFFRANLVRFDQITLASYDDRGGTHVDFAADDVVRHLVCTKGFYDFKLRHRSMNANATEASILVPQNERYSLAAAPDSSLIAMRVEQSALRRKLEAMIGDYIAGEIRFESTSNASALERLNRAILYVASELSFEETAYLSLAMREFQELLIFKLILAHEHNFSRLLVPTISTAPAPWQLRRVEEYIEANWNQPFSIEDLAALAGISGRTLLRHFKNWRGNTPMDFVKRIRLQHSKTLLEKPKNNTTVLSVALRCGFQSPGHFSRDYRKAFAELPSETLKRALRRDFE